MPSKPALDRARVVAAAVVVADREGIDRLTLRALAAELRTSPMAIYHYLPDKEAILDAMVDAVFDQIGLPQVGAPWRDVVATRAQALRAVLRAHPWATALMDSRTSPGPATLLHHDRTIEALSVAGLSRATIGHVGAVVDAFVYGFAIQEAALPFAGPETVSESVGAIIDAEVAGRYPHLSAFAADHVLVDGYDFGDEFAFGLDLILDGLERHQAAHP